MWNRYRKKLKIRLVTLVMILKFVCITSDQLGKLYVLQCIPSKVIRPHSDLVQLTLPPHFLQNCASSRPSSSVTSSRPVSFPLGTTSNQEEEATSTYGTPDPGKGEERTRGEFTYQYHKTMRKIRPFDLSTFKSVGAIFSF